MDVLEIVKPSISFRPGRPHGAAARVLLVCEARRGSESGEQRSRQVITGQANRGSMEHEKLPSPKRRSNTLTLSGTYSDRNRDAIRDRGTRNKAEPAEPAAASAARAPEHEAIFSAERVKTGHTHNTGAAEDTQW